MLYEVGNSLSTDTAPTTPKAQKNHREALASLDALRQRREAADATHAAELAAIKVETEAAAAIMQPLGVMLQERRLTLERIANATTVYNDQVAAADELDAALDQLLGSRNENGGRVNFGPAFNNPKIEPLLHASRAVELFDRWFEKTRAKLADLEKRMKAYAKANNLQYALPIALGGEAVE